MNKENIYITISREYGSGGREIGKKLDQWKLVEGRHVG